MPIGGMFIQILIQAAILRLSLKIIAKHEADTTYPKAIMVTSGVLIGQIAVAFIAARLGAWAVLPAVIAFTATIIMYFCWISFWKSVLVVMIYMGIQLLFLIGAALVMGTSILAMLGLSGGDSASATPNSYQQAADADREAQRIEAPSIEKQATIDAEIDRMEPNDTPTPPKPTVQPQPASPEIDWDGARKSLRTGGIIAGGRGFLAMINGKMVNDGQTVQAQYNGRQYRWRVKTITSKDVELEQLDVM